MHCTKIVIIAMLITACTVVIGGCWGRTEVDDLALVMAIGLDKGEDNTVYVTLQIAVPRAVASGGAEGGGPSAGGGGAGASLITTMRGRSILGLVDMANTYIDRRLSFVHSKVLIVSEDLARQGLAPYVSELVRFHEIRRTMFLAVAKGTAREFLTENKPVLEQNPAKNLELLTLASRKAGLIPPSQINRFLVEMQSLAEEPLVILAGINKEQQSAKEQAEKQSEGDEKAKAGEGNSTSQPNIPINASDIRYLAGESPSIGGNPVELLGAAVFRGDKMVGEITGEEVRHVLYLRGTFKQGITVVRSTEADDRFVSADLRLARPTQIRIERDGDEFRIKVNVTLEGGLVGSQEDQDYTNPKALRAVEMKLAHEVEKGCKDIIRRAQTEFSSDIFGFGNKARHLTMTWNEWQDLKWSEKFPNADVKVTVQVELRRTGLLFKSPQPSAD
ncbi:MAG TPA: Ger(x)C family spore germination protein [Firmicutes bacterium]|nr:Ger(x)C family spore germination protein [Bacillota bacterium]